MHPGDRPKVLGYAFPRAPNGPIQSGDGPLEFPSYTRAKYGTASVRRPKQPAALKVLPLTSVSGNLGFLVLPVSDFGIDPGSANHQEAGQKDGGRAHRQPVDQTDRLPRNVQRTGQGLSAHAGSPCGG